MHYLSNAAMLAFMLLLGIIAGANLEAKQATIQLVYNVCNASRITSSSNQGCADLQTQTHTEYLCHIGTNDPSEVCWVEVKG